MHARLRHPCHLRVCRPARGFTLVELLVTVAILGVLASMVLPVAQVAMQRAQEQDLRRALREIRRGIDAYKRFHDEGGVTRMTGDNGYPKTLEMLVDGVPDQRDPKLAKARFMRRIPRDPTNRDTSLPDAATWGKRSYASDAAEPQEGDDIYDVYSTTPGNGLNGVPYRQW